MLSRTDITDCDGRFEQEIIRGKQIYLISAKLWQNNSKPFAYQGNFKMSVLPKSQWVTDSN